MIRCLLATAPRAIASSPSSSSSAGIKSIAALPSARSSADLAAAHARAAIAGGYHYPPTCACGPRPFSDGAAPPDADDGPSVAVDCREDCGEEEEEDGPPPPPSSTCAPRRRARSEREAILESLPVTFADVSRAHVAIRTGVKRTPCARSHFLSELLGANIFLKAEFQQFTGSFKERGARNAILALLRENGGRERLGRSGVIAASAGNHALALAYHGKDLGVPVTVVMPTVAPLAKVDKCRVSRFRVHRFGVRQRSDSGDISKNHTVPISCVQPSGHDRSVD